MFNSLLACQRSIKEETGHNRWQDMILLLLRTHKRLFPWIEIQTSAMTSKAQREGPLWLLPAPLSLLFTHRSYFCLLLFFFKSYPSHSSQRPFVPAAPLPETSSHWTDTVAQKSLTQKDLSILPICKVCHQHSHPSLYPNLLPFCLSDHCLLSQYCRQQLAMNNEGMRRETKMGNSSLSLRGKNTVITIANS
jgi:hypothetical protein